MKCSIKRKEGRVVEVIGTDGNPSKVFDALKTIPGLTQEMALNAYTDLRSQDETLDTYRPEVKFVNRDTNEVFDSYKEALQADSTSISVLVNEVEAATLNPSFDYRTPDGFVNSNIKEGLMSDKKVVVEGEEFYMESGNSDSRRGVNKMFLTEDLQAYLGLDYNYKVTDNGIRITEVAKPQDPTLADTVAEEATKTFLERVGRLGGRESLTESELRDKFVSILNKLGVRAMSLEAYNKRYGAKNNTEAQAEAIADITNKIIAFAENEISIEALGEETAHFIIEATDSKTIAPLLEQVTATKEWKEHSEKYYKAYEKEYSKEQLEEAVRREILGKVLANAMVSQVEPTSFIQRVINLVTNFINRVRTRLTRKDVQSVEEFTQQLADTLIRKGDLSRISESALTQSQMRVMFRNPSYKIKSELAKPREAYEETLNTLDEAIKSLISGKAAFQTEQAIVRAKRKQLETQQDGVVTTMALKEVSDITTSIVTHLEAVMTEESYKKLKDRILALETKRETKPTAKEEQIFDTLNKKGEVNWSQPERLWVEAYLKQERQGTLTDAELKELNDKSLMYEEATTGNFTDFQNSAFQLLTNRLKPLIDGMLEGLKSRKDPLMKDVSDTFENISKRISALQEAHKSNVDSQINDLVSEVMMRYGLDESYRQYVKSWMENAHEDTNYLHSLFGLISNSQNPSLVLASYLGNRIFNESRHEATDRMRHYHSLLRDTGVRERDLKNLFDEGHLVSEYSVKKQQDFLDRMYGESYIEVVEGKSRSEITEADIEAFIEKSNNRELEELTQDQADRINTLNRDKRSKIAETYFKESYYQERNEIESRLGISEITKRRRSAFTRGRLSFLDKIKTIKGDRVYQDFSKLSEADKERVERLEFQRKMDKQIFTSEGGLKQGIESTKLTLEQLESKRLAGEIHQYAQVNGENYMIRSSIDAHTIEDSIIALDLQRLDKDYFDRVAKEAEKQGAERTGADLLTDDFLELLNQQPTEEAKMEFLRMNSTLQFNQRFWDTMDSENSIASIAKREIEGMPNSDEKQRILESISQLNRDRTIKKAITDQFRDSNRPFELKSDKMNDSTKERIREIDERMTTVRRELWDFVNENFPEKLEDRPANEGMSEFNEAFYRDVEDSGERAQDFLKRALSSEQYGRFLNFTMSVDRAKNRSIGTAAQSFHASFIKGFLEGKGIEVDTEMSFRDMERTGQLKPEWIEEMKMAYAANQAPSYYKRYVPKEVESFGKRLENMNSQEIIDAARNSKYVELRPNYTFLSEGVTSKDINPNYNPNFEGLFQPKASEAHRFRSSKFQELFGKAPAEGQEPSRNQGLYKALQIMKQMKAEANENNGRSHASILDVPQVYSRGVDRLVKSIGLNKDALKANVDNLRDLFIYREDELEYGSQIGNVKTIPVMYSRKLKQADLLSDELFTTYMMDLQQSILHKTRKKYAGRFGALATKAAMGSTARGKYNDATNTYKMLNNYMNYALYGQRESLEFKMPFMGKEIDLTRVARVFTSVFRAKNLALTPIVPLTSMVTEGLQYSIDKRVGEIVDKDAAKLAMKSFMRLAPDAMKDVGKIHSKSELNILMESLGIRSTEDRFKNSNYSGSMRFLNQISMGMHQMMSFPVTERIALSVLHDFRIVDGQIQDFREFRLKKLTENENKMKESQIREEWRAHESKAIINYLDIKENQAARFKPEVAEMLNEVEGYSKEEYMDSRLNRAIDKSKMAVQRMDTLLTEADRTEAQRNFLLAFTTTHKQWLPMVTQNRFKRIQRNLGSGQIEEGSYRTLWGLGYDILSNFKNGGIKTFQEAWNGEYLPEFNKDIGLTEELKKDHPEAYRRLRVELLDMQRRNLKRVAWDTAVILATMTVGSLLFALNDDEDFEENYAINMANYMMLRSIHQQLGNMTGVPSAIWDTVKDPIVGAQNMMDTALLPYNLIVDGGYHDQGYYKGRSRRLVHLERTMPGFKSWNDMTNLNQKSQQYYKFNEESIDKSFLGLYYTKLNKMFTENEK